MARSHVVLDGQSLAVDQPNQTEDVDSQLHRMLRGRHQCATVAVGATAYSGRESNAATRWGPQLAWPLPKIAIDIAGQTELWNDVSAASLHSQATTYWTNRRAAGVSKVVQTTVPYDSHFAASASQEAARLAYNELVRASDAYDGVVDFALDPRFLALDATYRADFIHPTALGAWVMADLIRLVLDRVTGSR